MHWPPRASKFGESYRAILWIVVLLPIGCTSETSPPTVADGASSGPKVPPIPGQPSVPPAPAASQDSAALEQAWLELIAVYEKQFQKLASVHNESQAEKAAESALQYHRDKHAALTKIAKLGGEKPPIGVPSKLAAQYRDAENRLYARDEVVSQMISPERREQLNEDIRKQLSADPTLAVDPFRLPAAIRTSPDQVTVILVNNKSLQGEMHQQMIARLRELSGAGNAEILIENDGTYKLVLAPVPDFNRFATSIPFGDVSNRDDSSRTFTLTIDPQKFQPLARSNSANQSGPPRPNPGGRPGAKAPPYAGPSAEGGNSNPVMEQRKQEFIARAGGLEKCAILVLENAPPRNSPELNSLLGKIRQTTGARSSMGMHVNGRTAYLIAPIDDFAAVVAKIDFGSVTSQDPATREITVDVGGSAGQ
jgi:hypothetical protein